jgi:hypothetical protein
MTMDRLHVASLSAAFVLSALSGQALAQSPGDQSGKRPPHPPQFAIEACAGKKAGDVVQVTPPDRDSITATCTNSPDGLFARPAHPPQDQPGGNRQPG